MHFQVSSCNIAMPSLVILAASVFEISCEKTTQTIHLFIIITPVGSTHKKLKYIQHKNIQSLRQKTFSKTYKFKTLYQQNTATSYSLIEQHQSPDRGWNISTLFCHIHTYSKSTKTLQYCYHMCGFSCVK